MMRIAFRPFGGHSWLGGHQYLTTLLSALRDEAPTRAEPVLFAANDVPDERLDDLRSFVRNDPIRYGKASAPQKALGTIIDASVRRRDSEFEKACQRADIDLVFQHADWLGSGFSIPSLAWLGDFQHRAMPEMFPYHRSARRELRFRNVLRTASLVYVLSETDRAIGATLYPRHSDKIVALPFAVGLSPDVYERDPRETVDQYALPPRFFLFPSQFWKHKNHLGVIEAMSRVDSAGDRPFLVFCGNTADARNPSHGGSVLRRITELRLDSEVRVLGVVPRRDLWALMRASVAVVNPSLYEGWSTSIEEARVLGAPVVVSDLPVHREQEPGVAYYFDPRDPDSIAAALGTAWRELPSGPRPLDEECAANQVPDRRRSFANEFLSLAEQAIAWGSQRSKG
jgi:glycosyltransferase involved in cell wall biosynthesis